MGKVKAWAMDLEDQFFEAASDVILECDSFEEWFDLMKPQMNLVVHMDKEDVFNALTEIWNECLSYAQR